jgi:hypothetical protein
LQPYEQDKATASCALRALRPLPQQAARQVGARVRGHGHQQIRGGHKQRAVQHAHRGRPARKRPVAAAALVHRPERRARQQYAPPGDRTRVGQDAQCRSAATPWSLSVRLCLSSALVGYPDLPCARAGRSASRGKAAPQQQGQRSASEGEKCLAEAFGWQGAPVREGGRDERAAEEQLLAHARRGSHPQHVDRAEVA